MLDTLIYGQPGHLIRRAHQLSWSVFREEATGSGLTPVQYAALVAIASNPGVDATRLSQLIFFDRATIGNVLERLEKKGLIIRTAHQKDRRAKSTHITAAGRKQINSIKKCAPRIAERIFGRLKMTERAELLRLLRIVLDVQEDDASPKRSSKRKRLAE